MKPFLTIIFFILLINFSSNAQDTKRSLLYKFVADKQQQGVSFSNEAVFDNTRSEYVSRSSIVSDYTILSLNKQAINDIASKKPSGMKVAIPLAENQTYTLVLAAEQINSSGDFSFGTIANNINTRTSADQGLHYRGYIAGDSNSLACLSFFKNGEVIGVFANKDGNFVIGKMKDSSARYVVYKSSDMVIQPRYKCATSEVVSPSPPFADRNVAVGTIAEAPPVLCKKVRFYWEADYRLYNYNFGADITKVQNYLTGLFNVVATLYQNEGIIIELSKTFVWTSADPYANANSNQGLNSFKARWNSLGNNYEGDLAHLIAGGTTNNGGVAFILNFDQCNRPYTYGYSNVYATFQSYPNYSWDAQVLTHETGHNLGSNHTHWCGWNTGPGNTCGAIDNCAALEQGGGCTTCAATTDITALPAGFKGSVMSYCYLNNGIGVSFVNGFGPLPQAVIRNNVTAATCLTSRNMWTGSVSTAWENTGNWSCGSLPDANTDVLINAGLTNYPVINSTTATCKSLKEAAGASIRVNNNFRLTITGKPVN
ncbi:MAG: M12 family metallo-peptidase [Ferruginibacter sp.]